MRAAVIHDFGDVPRCEEFPDPVAAEGDVTIRVSAVVLENFDRMAASGTHYASRHLYPEFPAVVGHSGVGRREDGTLVTFGGVRPPYGTMAELAVVPAEMSPYVMPVPEGVDGAVAASLPAAALTSLLPLGHGVRIQPGETVLINGATGVSGRLAVQIARLLGAGRIVGTGRSQASLAALEALGATAIVDLKASDEEIVRAFADAADGGYDVVLDFLWGRPTELLLKSIVPREVGFARRRVRLVQIGQAAGPTLALDAEAVRTSGLEITGAGSVPPEAVPEALKQVWSWVGEGKLHIDLDLVPLEEVTEVWARETEGRRVVIVPS
jgi:NADPH:quinone reductase-like Zn-dependent oxidoreductase